MIQRLIIAVVVLMASSLAAQTDGALDPAFNPTGGTDGTVQAIATQPDGRVLIAGSFRHVNGLARNGLARMMDDGSVDQSFAPSFTLGTDGSIFALLQQPDGKILVGGYFSNGGGSNQSSLVRLNSNGSLDSTFNAGFVTGESVVFALALRADGRIYAGGTFIKVGSATRNCIVRLLSNGGVDPAFVPRENLFLLSSGPAILALVTEDDGGVVAGGAFSSGSSGADPQFTNLMRFKADGSVDGGFPLTGGLTAAASLSSMVRQSDGSVLISGNFSYGADRPGVVRFDKNWARDTSFNPRFGKTGQSYPADTYALAVEPGGGILVGGEFDTVNGVARARIARLRPDGTLDPRFMPTVPVTGGDVAVVALDAQQRILVGGDFTAIAGTARVGLARLLNPPLPPLILSQSLSAAASVGDNIHVAVTAELSSGLTYQWFNNGVPIAGADGPDLYLVNVQAAGSYTLTVTNRAGSVTSDPIPVTVQLRTPGAEDVTFVPDMPPSTSISTSYTIAIPRTDGRVYLGGVILGWTQIFLINRDGSRDPGFTFGQDRTYYLSGGVTAADGRTYLYGSSLPLNGSLVRLNADGSLDQGFSPATRWTNITSIRVAADGKLYVYADGALSRLRTDGSVDPDFTVPEPVRKTQVGRMETGPDGTLYLSGSFTIDGASRSLIRLKPDGAVDPAFSVSDLAVGNFAVAPDGSIYAATSNFGLRRLTAGGQMDPGFACTLQNVVTNGGGSREFVFPSGPAEIRFSPAGKVVIVNWGTRINGENVAGPVQLNADGSRDTSFQTPADGKYILSMVDDGAGHWVALRATTTQGAPAGYERVTRHFQTGPGATRLVNLSTRAVAGVGERALIAGFVMTGTGSRPLLLRGAGPALRAQGVSGPLAEPGMYLYHGPESLESNQGWANNPDVAAAAVRVGAFALEANSRDAALWKTLSAGIYSTMIAAPEGNEGVALAEAYDDGAATSNDTRLVNLSARAPTETGDRVLIAGFVVTGSGDKQVLLRAVGPGLTGMGVKQALADPVLRVMRAGRVVAENDNWASGADAGYVAGAARQVGAFALGANSRDAAVLLTVTPGVYSVVVSPVDGTANGIGMVEVYEVSQ